MIAHTTYDPGAGTFTLTKGAWHGTYPISELRKRLAFYRRQQELFPTYASFYEDNVVALTGLLGKVPHVRSVVQADMDAPFHQSPLPTY